MVSTETCIVHKTHRYISTILIKLYLLNLAPGNVSKLVYDRLMLLKINLIDFSALAFTVYCREQIKSLNVNNCVL